MDFVLLGTGCPQCDPLRMGPSNLVRHEGRAFLVDCGSATCAAIGRPCASKPVQVLSAGMPRRLNGAVMSGRRR